MQWFTRDVTGLFELVADQPADTSLEGMLARRASWYRMEAREKTNSRATLAEPKTILFRRAIVRAGYFIQPTDMPEDAALEKALEIVMEEANASWQYAPAERRVQSQSGLWMGLGIDLVAVKAIVNAMSTNQGHMFHLLRRPLQQARRAWLEDVKDELKGRDCTIPLNLRTFWYTDLGYQAVGQIMAVKNRWVGEYMPGSPGSASYDGDYDPDPAGLNQWSHHQIYEVCAIGAGRMFVHPDDVEMESRD